MSSTVACRFGVECRRKDCWFTHPPGRLIDQTTAFNTYAAPYAAYANTYAAVKPLDQSDTSLPNLQSLSLTDSAAFVGRSAAGHRKNSCRFGRQCHRADCYFEHPNGRIIDEQQNEQGQPEDHFDPDDVDDESLTAEFYCPCCHNRPDKCQTPSCQAAGRCACQADLVTVDDDQADEWFPASRECKCCLGYVYNCKREHELCQKTGTCFCSFVNKDDLTQSTTQSQTQTQSTTESKTNSSNDNTTGSNDDSRKTRSPNRSPVKCPSKSKEGVSAH